MSRIAMNDSWQFAKLPGISLETLRQAGSWNGLEPGIEGCVMEEITLPHTWYRDADPYRGLTVYQKKVTVQPDWTCVFVDVPAADQQALVFADDVLIADHLGGYSAFRGEVPAGVLQSGEFTLRIFVSNEVNDRISPLAGDFVVYGGLYRGVNLIPAAHTHFDYLYYGTNGILARTKLEADGTGVLCAEPHAVAGEGTILRCTILDAQGTAVAEEEGSTDKVLTLRVPDCTPWDGRRQPCLYTLRAQLLEAGKTVDCMEEAIGFRSISIDPDHGFFLNGRHLRLNGVACHQDRDGAFCAKSAGDIDRDFEFVREIGANALRLSHYQHPQHTYDLADRGGYVVWAEIPLLKLPRSRAVLENARRQLTELILQNLHHPGICFWGIQNEIGMYQDAPYMYDALNELRTLARALDPDRLITGANLYTVKAKSGFNAATDMVGYNIYFGWYYGKMQDYDSFLDGLHNKRPDLPLGISEYGVDANPGLHAADPKVQDYSEEYQALFHETVYPIFRSKEYLWGTFVWNLFDFASPMRREGGTVNRNQKGLVTFDRAVRKDAFYYYKAQWSEEPFVHLCSRRFEERTESVTEIRVYTNQPRVALRVNGAPALEQETDGNGTAVFKGVALADGENRIEAASGGAEDSCVLIRTDCANQSYALPDSGAGRTVRNWFLQDDDIVREGYYSIKDLACDLLAEDRCREALSQYAPDLFRLMTTRDVVPLGLPLESILRRNPDGVDQRALNEALNQIPSED